MCQDRYYDEVKKLYDWYAESKLNFNIDGNHRLKKKLDMSLPFFAYGFLKDNEPGYGIIKSYVDQSTIIDFKVSNHVMYFKDGVPVAIEGNGIITGRLLRFVKGSAEQAYRNIAIMKIGELYSWKEIEDIHGRKYNMLVLSKDVSGNDNELISLVKSKNNKWSSGEDAFFSDVMQFLYSKYYLPLLSGELIAAYSMIDLSIALQMAYMQLWAIIDRYSTMACWIDNRKVQAKVRIFAKINERFKQALEMFNNDFPSLMIKKVYHSCDGYYVKFSKENIIDYYYAIRCNTVHRGKGTDKRDIDILKYAFLELFSIMYAVINYDFSLIDKVKNYR